MYTKSKEATDRVGASVDKTNTGGNAVSQESPLQMSPGSLCYEITEEQLTRNFKKEKVETERDRDDEKILTAELQSNWSLIQQLQCDVQTGEEICLQLKEEAKRFTDEIKMNNDDELVLLSYFTANCKMFNERFLCAPELYHIENISNQIEEMLNEFSQTENIIQEEYDPDISNSNVQMEDEPYTIINMQGAPPAKLTSKALQILIDKLQGKAGSHKEKIENGRKMLDQMIREEDEI